MADLDYTFIQQYGFEPYADNNGGGGAKLTSENLIVTTWSIEEIFVEPPGYVEFGELLKPNTINDNATLAERNASAQAFPSRTSAQCYLNAGESELDIEMLGFVINPPAEYKQRLANALSFNGGLTDDLENYTVKKSLQVCYTWKTSLLGADAHNYFQLARELEFFYSTYLFFNDSQDAEARLPFLKTSGADGQKPVFFDVSTVSGVKEMIDAVNRGEFFVLLAMEYEPEENPPGVFNISYPHSIARV